MPEGFAFPVDHQVWIPLRRTDVAPLEGPAVSVFGRLAPGADFESARAELSVVGRRMAASHPETHARLVPEVGAYAGPTPGDPVPPAVFLMHGVVFLVLGLACANVATLVFARTALREAEIATRTALGANRGKVVAQLVVEALVLSSAAAAAGLVLAHGVLSWFWREAVQVWQVPQPFWRNGDIEPSTVLYTAGLAVAGAVMVGVVPALKATGTDIRERLSRLSGGGTTMSFGGMWSVVIVGQVALTVVCLPVSAGITAEVLRDRRVRSTFPADEFLSFRLELDREEAFAPSGQRGDATFPHRLAAAWGELERRLREERGVRDVTFGSRLPGTSRPLRRVEVQRGMESPVLLRGNLQGMAAVLHVEPGFFDAFSTRVVSGRGFHAGDPTSEPGSVIVNEAFVRNLGGDAVGARLRYAAPAGEQPGPWHEIVGVAADLGVEPTERGEGDMVFHAANPARAHPLEVAVRTRGDPEALVADLPALALEVDAGLRLYDILPLDEVLRRRNLPMVMISAGATGVLAVALLLSVAGLFALMSVAVQQRTREIGIRLALGAGRRSVLVAVFGRAARQVVLGILIGNGVIAAVTGLAGGGFDRAMLMPMLAISGLMALVGLAACALPARRALGIEPTEALREA